MTPQETARALWMAFDRLDFEAAADLLHDDFICEWVQSGERVRGKANYIAINRYYPGQWRIHIMRVVTSGDEVVTEVEVHIDGRIDRAVSFFTVQDGKIKHLREYWPDPMPAAEWRRQWVELMG